MHEGVKAMSQQPASTEYVIETQPIPSLAVVGTDQRFPIHRVYCVGRNYADHAIEMGHDPNREAPFFFQKNPDNVIPSGSDFPYPPQTKDVHHEMEMVVAIGKGGTDIPVERALEHVYGYAVGPDLTRRDLQAEAKKLGRPWEVAKAFEASAPCSAVVPASKIGHPQQGAVWLKVNGVIKQSGDLNQLIWKVPEMIAYLSSLFTLRPGDLIFSGTPAGVGPVKRGDQLQGGVDGIGEIEIRVV
jgi:fumarylpyruvate hydrolase